MDMVWEARNRHHRTARARIQLRLFQSKSQQLSTAYLLGEVEEQFILEQIAGNWSESES